MKEMRQKKKCNERSGDADKAADDERGTQQGAAFSRPLAEMVGKALGMPSVIMPEMNCGHTRIAASSPLPAGCRRRAVTMPVPAFKSTIPNFAQTIG